jgi:uncharacterized Ntn-hydrolase superfamily protein
MPARTRIVTIDEINALAKALSRKIEGKSKEKKKKESIDEILELLVLAYVFGWNRVDSDSNAIIDKMFEAVYLLIDGMTFEDRIREHIENGDWEEAVIQRLMETEYHRVEETGAYDCAKEYERRTGKIGYKKWSTMKDERVRDTHWYLEGTEVLLTGTFYTYDGDSANFPGGFSKVENNANCRCELLYSFR